MIDKWYEEASKWLGSTYVVGLFALWLLIHTIIERDYISFISELAILLGLLILRAETVQSERTEKAVKKDLKESNEIKKLLNKKIEVKK